MWRARCVVGIACVLGVLASLSFTALGGNLEGLKHDKWEVRREAFDRILKERKDRVQQLIALAATEVQGFELRVGDWIMVEYPWHDSKHLAIILLGDLRAAEGVPVLVENLEYNNPRTMDATKDETFVGEGVPLYPATDALIKIGMPSVGPLVEKLRGYSEDCRGRYLCLVMLKQILGLKLAEARLKIAIKEAETALAEDPARAIVRTGRPPDKAKLRATLANLMAALDRLRDPSYQPPPPGKSVK